MSEQQNDVIRQLEDLEARIEERRRAMQERGVLGDQLEQEWDDMLRQHAAIRRRLRAGKGAGSQARATLNEDIDVLRHAFFRWAARVDERFKVRRRN